MESKFNFNFQSSRRVKQAIEKVLGKSPEKASTKKQTKRKREENVATKSAENEEEIIIKRKRKTVKASQDVDEEPTASQPKDWKKEEEMEKQKAKQNAIKLLKSKGKSQTKKPKIIASFENPITEESDHDVDDVDEDSNATQPKDWKK